MKPVDTTDAKKLNALKTRTDEKLKQNSIQRVLKQHSNKLDVSKVSAFALKTKAPPLSCISVIDLGAFLGADSAA